jgi:hypothetical protein
MAVQNSVQVHQRKFKIKLALQYEGSELKADAFDKINNSETFYTPTEVQEVIDL